MKMIIYIGKFAKHGSGRGLNEGGRRLGTFIGLCKIMTIVCKKFTNIFCRKNMWSFSELEGRKEVYMTA